MVKIFIDADIIIDLLAKREPHYLYAAELFTRIDKDAIKAFTSPIIIANIFYILRKIISKEKALISLRKLKSLVKIFKFL